MIQVSIYLEDPLNDHQKIFTIKANRKTPVAIKNHHICLGYLVNFAYLVLVPKIEFSLNIIYSNAPNDYKTTDKHFNKLSNVILLLTILRTHGIDEQTSFKCTACDKGMGERLQITKGVGC